MALASDGARPDRAISCPRRPVTDRGALDRGVPVIWLVLMAAPV